MMPGRDKAEPNPGPDFFALLMKNVTDYAFVLMDGKGRITGWNRGAEMIFGFSLDEVRGQDIALIYSAEDIEMKVPERELLAIDSNDLVPNERWFVRKDGTSFWGSGLAYSLKDESGAVHGFVKVIRDIHDKVQAADALLVSEKKMEFFMENLKDHALFMINKDACIASWNKGAERLFGHEELEILGQPFSSIFTQDDIHAGIPEKELDTAKRHGKAEDERWHRRKDGGLFWASGSVMPLVDKQGVSYAFIKILRDATERKRSEEDQKMRSIGRLAGGISHDFNNLLTTINGYCHLLKHEADLDDTALEWVEDIHRAGERAATVTSQILAFSSRQILAPKPSQLNEIITNSKSLLERTLGDGIRLKIRLHPQLEKIMVDPVQFELVLLNLALNAREAMPKGGEITLETKRVEVGTEPHSEQFTLNPGPYAQLIFRDTGKGMSLEVKARIFEPFYSTKKQGTNSSGLGLSTVFGIVRQSEGAIAVTSETGNGTEFKIYLPFVRKDSVREEVVTPVVPMDVSLKERCILLVEDEETVRKLTFHVLKMGGYKVLEAKDGVEALSQYRSHAGSIHMVLTDVVMPNMGGLELAQRIMASNPEVPIAFMSGYTEQSVMPNGLLERSIFIQKPYEIPELLEKIQTALGVKSPV